MTAIKLNKILETEYCDIPSMPGNKNAQNPKNEISEILEMDYVKILNFKILQMNKYLI